MQYTIPLTIGAFVCYRKIINNRPRDIKCYAKLNVDYSDVLRSAARSKMAYQNPEEVNTLWKNSKEASATAEMTTFEKWIIPQLAALKMAPVFITSPQDAQAYFWKNEKELYLTYRGTSSAKDALADANIRSCHIKDDIYVHKGFYDQFMSIEKETTDLIRKEYNALSNEADTTTINLNIAGHSLGAGLAQFASAYYGEMFPEAIVTCHTVGCPRTGNEGFVNWFAKHVRSHVRVVNNNDPVTMIPQRPLWTHTHNQCIEIDDACNVKIIARDTPWYLRMVASLIDVDFFAPIADHDCDLYINRLQKLYDQESI